MASSSSLKAADGSDNRQETMSVTDDHKPLKRPKRFTFPNQGAGLVTDALKFDIERRDKPSTDSNTSFREPPSTDSNTSFRESPPFSEPPSGLYFEPVTYMDPQLYRSAIAGNFDAFLQDIESGSRLCCDQVTPRGNTVLHLAAAFGHNQLVQFLVDRCPRLVWEENYEGDLALHVAACGGHQSMLQSLLLASQGLASQELLPTNPEGETDFICALKRVNEKGNTALHIALENRHQEVADFLFKEDMTVLNYMNSKGKSPLCLAAEAGYTELVQRMTPERHVQRRQYAQHFQYLWEIRRSYEEDIEKEEFEEGNSLVHAAIKGRNKAMLEALYDDEAALIKLSMDEEGRTALSFAAYKGYLNVVQFLLDKSTKIAYIRDRDGFFPIHMASREGHIEIVQKFLDRCPDSRELLVGQDCLNILHVAAMYGKAKMVTYMLKTQELEMLINERDRAGNTPLHYATKHWHPKVVSILTWDKRVHLEAVNDKDMTAMDVAKKKMEPVAPFRKILTVNALKSAKAPSSELRASFRKDQKKISTLEEPPNIDPYKNRIEILVLVSTLVATVTFAAGFTMPGGNNDSGKDEGIATMVTKPAFHAFLICNTIAMYSSIIVVISLIFAQLGDLSLILSALRVALPFLALAVMTMSAAFMTGTYLVVSNHNLLAIFVLILGSIFFIILLALFILLYSPTHYHNHIARYVFYYPFCWMILVTRSDVDRKKRVIFTDWK